jgi:hypothetical protein
VIKKDFRTRQANGTGLGLYITKKLAHRLGAKIDLQSEPDKGAVFMVEIPNLQEAEATPAVDQPAETQPPAEAQPTPEMTSPEPAKTEVSA